MTWKSRWYTHLDTGAQRLRLSEADRSDIQPGKLTEWLERWHENGEPDAADVTAVVYTELRRLAARFLASERPNHTLQATALVHEVYLQLCRTPQYEWKNRAQFIAVAAQMMRRILVDHARKFRAAKRGFGKVLPLDEAQNLVAAPDPDLVVLDEALDRLAAEYPRQAQVVELRFFGGLNNEEAVEVLRAGGTDVSLRTVERDWRFAGAWLEQAMGAG